MSQMNLASKHVLPCLLLSVLLLPAACHRDGLSREQRLARAAAEKCYRYLQKGKYEKFVDEIAYSDQMSEEYHSQMADLVHEYAATLQKDHGSLLSIKAVGDSLLAGKAHVYLQLTFADSTSEEVGVPMVLVGEEWKMQ